MPNLQGNLTRHKRQALGVNHCSPQNQHVSIPRVCLAENVTTTVIIPFSALKRRGVAASTSGYGQSYPWYMTNDQLKTDWSTLVADPAGYDWSKYSSTEAAKHQRSKIKMSVTATGIQITVNLTNNGTLHPKGNGTYCWFFMLWVWKAGTDEGFNFSMCQNRTANMTRSELSTIAKETGIIIMDKRTTVDEWFQVTTGVSGHSNNWLFLREQATGVIKSDCVVCMGPRPILRVVPASVNSSCIKNLMSNTNPKAECAIWDKSFPNTKIEKKKTIFSKKVAPGNFSCVNITGTGEKLGNLSAEWCSYTQDVDETFQPVSRSDIWWWCGDGRLFDRLPLNITGYCALVSLLTPVSVYPMSTELLTLSLTSVMPDTWRKKRSTSAVWLPASDPTYMDAITVPCGVPDEYKLVNQVASGFESSLCWWCTINKNVDRINYIHYNVQALGNWTRSGFEAVHDQLAATSLMAFQNRIALDMLLAEKGGVCAMFGEQCCTFIPNNTAADGSLTKAIEGLRTLNAKMKEHSGVDTTMWDSWMDMFGRYKMLVSSALISVAVFAAILTLCGCCCIPCLRSLINRLITTAIAPAEQDMAQLYPLLGGRPDSDNEGDIRLSDCFPDADNHQ